MGDKRQYFNFPIRMMRGLFYAGQNKRIDFLSCVLYYHIQKHAEKLEEMDEWNEDEEDRFLKSAKYWNVSIGGSVIEKMNLAKTLIKDYQDAKVFAGINTDIFWDFYKNPKTEFEWQCLIAFLALKSIVGNKTHCKSNNWLLYARMDGVESTKDGPQIEPSRYLRDKIISELEDNWGLVYYSRYTKGFYFSFSMELVDLVEYAEIRRKSVKENLKKEAKKVALASALKKISKI